MNTLIVYHSTLVGTSMFLSKTPTFPFSIIGTVHKHLLGGPDAKKGGALNFCQGALKKVIPYRKFSRKMHLHAFLWD